MKGMNIIMLSIVIWVSPVFMSGGGSMTSSQVRSKVLLPHPVHHTIKREVDRIIAEDRALVDSSRALVEQSSALKEKTDSLLYQTILLNRRSNKVKKKVYSMNYLPEPQIYQICIEMEYPEVKYEQEVKQNWFQSLFRKRK